jgi:septum formation topological specificity factor MinE
MRLACCARLLLRYIVAESRDAVNAELQAVNQLKRDILRVVRECHVGVDEMS